MSKEAYYFSHDANARNDEKILMLRADHGWEGYGVYWALLEMMFENADTNLSHNKIKGIAVSYNIDITLLNDVINTCITESLFVSDGDKFWSESLLRRKRKYQEIKEKKSAAGKKGMEKRWGNKQKDNTVITDDIKNDNDVITKNNKGKEIKEKEIKENKQQLHKENVVVDVNPFDFYQQNFGMLSPYIAEDIEIWIKDLSDDLVIEAMKITLQSQKNWKYTTGILRDWMNRRLKTITDVQAYNKEYENKKNVRIGKTKTSKEDFNLDD